MATKQQVEQLNDAVAGLGTQQQHIDALASDLKTHLGDFREQLGSTNGHDVPGEIGARIDQLEKKIELASSKIDEQVYALKSRVTGFAEGVENWFKPARSEIDANRAFVEQASEQIRQKLQGFEKAAEDLQSCVDGGVSDLQRRHESRDASLVALSAKIDDCLGRLDEHADRTGERALEHFRPLIDGLTTHISQSCVGQKQLADHLRNVQMEIEAAVARSEQRVTPTLSDFSSRLDSSTTMAEEIRETCRALQNHLGGAVGRLEERIADIQRSIDTSLSTKLDDKIAGLQKQITDMLTSASEGNRESVERVTGQIAGVQEGLEAWSRRSEEDAVHRTELSWEQKELGAALGRLEEKIETALQSFTGQSAEHKEEAAGVARQLGEMRSKLSDSVDPVISALKSRDRDADAAAAVVSLGFKDVQQQLTAISEQLDARVARSLSEMHAQSQEVYDEAAAQRNDLTAGQKELGMAMLRLQSRVTDSLANLTDQQTKHGDQAGNLAGELGNLREQLSTLVDQLANVGDQFGVMTAEIDNRMTAALADADRSARVEFTSVRNDLADLSTAIATSGGSEGSGGMGSEGLTILTQQLGKLRDQVSVALEKRETAGASAGSKADRELKDLRAALEAVPGQVRDRVADAVAELGRTSSREQEQLTAVERQLDDLREQLSTVGDRFDGIIGDLDNRISAGAGKESGSKEDGAGVLRMMDDLRTAIAAVGTKVGDSLEPLADVPAQVEDKITAAITKLTRTPSREQEQLTGVERQLDDLREHIASLSERLDDVGTAASDGSGGVSAESAGRIAKTVEQGMSTLRDQLEAVAGQVDTRVSELMAAQPRQETVTPAHLSDVVGRLEQQVTTAIGEVTVREPDGDLSRQLETQLDALQAQLSMLGDRFGALESSLSDIDTVTHVETAPDDDGVERSLEGIRSRFEAARQEIEGMATDTDSYVDEAPQADIDELDEQTPPMDAVSADEVDVIEDTVTFEDEGLQDETVAYEDTSYDDDTVASYEDTSSYDDTVASIEESESFDDTETPQDVQSYADTDSYEDTTTFQGTVQSDDEATFDDPEPYRDATEDTVEETVEEIDDEPASTASPKAPMEPEVAPLPIEELVHTMIGVINSGNSELMQKFIAEQYAASALAERDAEARVEVFMGVHEETGEMRVVNWEVGDEGEIIVVLQTRLSLDRMRFEIIRDNAAAHKITQINIDRI